MGTRETRPLCVQLALWDPVLGAGHAAPAAWGCLASQSRCFPSGKVPSRLSRSLRPRHGAQIRILEGLEPPCRLSQQHQCREAERSHLKPGPGVRSLTPRRPWSRRQLVTAAAAPVPDALSPRCSSSGDTAGLGHRDAGPRTSPQHGQEPMSGRGKTHGDSLSFPIQAAAALTLVA